MTRQQDNLQSFVVQPLDGVERFGTDGIRDRKYGEHPVAFHQVGCRLTIGCR